MPKATANVQSAPVELETLEAVLERQAAENAAMAAVPAHVVQACGIRNGMQRDEILRRLRDAGAM